MVSRLMFVLLGFFVLTPSARAELIRYQYEASVYNFQDSSGVLATLGMQGVNELVTGTLIYDTATKLQVTQPTSAYSLGSALGSQPTDGQGFADGVAISWGSGWKSASLQVAEYVDPKYEDRMSFNTIGSAAAINGVPIQHIQEGITFYGSFDYLSTSLPSELALGDFTRVVYSMNLTATDGTKSSRLARLTSLTRIGGNAQTVPELDADGATGGATLLFLALAILNGRRRDERWRLTSSRRARLSTNTRGD